MAIWNRSNRCVSFRTNRLKIRKKTVNVLRSPTVWTTSPTLWMWAQMWRCAGRIQTNPSSSQFPRRICLMMFGGRRIGATTLRRSHRPIETVHVPQFHVSHLFTCPFPSPTSCLWRLFTSIQASRRIWSARTRSRSAQTGAHHVSVTLTFWIIQR